MRLACIRSGAILLCASLLHACGGGGGGNGGSNPPDPVARLTVSSTIVSVAATPGELAPEDIVTLAVTNPPDVLYLGVGHSTSGLERVEFTQNGPAQGELQFFFKSPGSLTNGTYQDIVDIHVCPDDQCRTEISDSPQNVSIAYVVSGDGLTTATLSRTVISLTADQRQTGSPEETTTITLSNLPPSGVLTRADESSNAIRSVGSIDLGMVRTLVVDFTPPDQLALGEHNDSIALRLCYDESCVRQVTGSPFAISTNYTIAIGVEPGLSSLQALRRKALGHDVIDAEYSAAMNAIVTVGSNPTNAIYVYDMNNDIESRQDLAMPPTAVSVSPDGLTAAVGHDSHISIVDLPMVGAAGAPAPTVLNVGTRVNDLVLDGAGHVYAVPTIVDGDNIFNVDIATNTEQQTPASVEHIRLRPSANSIYGVQDSVPSNLDKWDVSSGIAGYLYGWQYSSEHTACFDFWFNESGDRIYTGCGETFSASDDPGQDMIYAGSIPLTPPATYSENSIRSLSHSAARGEIALIESHAFDCNPVISRNPCFTRLAYYEDAFLNLQARFGIGPITQGGTPYAYLGRFVFHDSNTGNKYLIGELENPPSENLRFWLTVVQ